MLTLNDGRKEMYQWDIGRIATVDVECDVVHFSNLKYGVSLSVEVKNGEVAIPNKLLTSGEPIYCWAFVSDENGNYTKQEQTLNVNKRAKPSDYVYTETETLTWKSLDERITELENSGTGGYGDMQKSVYDPNNRAKDMFKYADDAAKLAVTNHALSNTAHSDIRDLITGLTNRLNALADSDDTTLDQLSEIVAYIKSNKSLIDAITTSKVSVSDIIDNLTTNNANKPLSAAQGVALKALIDGITIPEKLPNPNALTFTGAVTGSYDGSAPLEVAIPSGEGGTGGGGDVFELIGEATSSGVSDTVGLTIPFDGSLYKTIVAYAYNLPAGNKKRIIIRRNKSWYDGYPMGWNGVLDTYLNSTSINNMNNTWGFFGAAIDLGGKLFSIGAAESKNNGGHGYFRLYPQDGALPTSSLSEFKFISLDCNSNSEIIPDGCSIIAWGVRK